MRRLGASELDDPRASAAVGAAHVGAVIGAATVGAHLCQVLWLTLGARTMGLSTFGAVLAAQALYAVLQTLLDIGPSQVGARRAAQGPVDDGLRGALTRVRLGVAVPAACAALGFAAIGHGDSAVAVLPFAAALPLFALLNVWERFGTGDARPLAAYLFLRSAAPAAAAGTCLVLSVSFPPFLAGLMECASILAVMAVYRLQPLRLARAMRVARREPLEPMARIGAVSILFQLTVSSGTLLLSASGANAAAAVLAVGLRLVTGLNSLLGVLGSAIFPGLARTSGDGSLGTGDVRAAEIVLRLVTAVSAAAAAAVVLLAGPLLALFLEHSSEAGEVGLILVVAAVPAAAISVALSLILVARHAERHMLSPFVAGAVLSAGLGAASLAVHPEGPESMGAAMLVGQLGTCIGVVLRMRHDLPELRRSAATSAVSAALVAASAGAAAAGTGAVRMVAAGLMGALAISWGWAPARLLAARLRSASAAHR